MRYNVAVIGAGASGMTAALFAAKNGARVTVFEKNGEPLKKLLRTGNGKCNLTNSSIDLNEYVSSDVDFVKDKLFSFSNNDLIHFFKTLGLVTKDKNGYVYPLNEQASSVSGVLLKEASVYGINIKTDCLVNMIAKDNDRFLISIEGEKQRYEFDRVIVSTGSKAGLLKGEKENSEKLLKTFNVSFIPFVPGLNKLILNGYDFETVKGVRNEAKVCLIKNREVIKEECGEILFWEKGISGICVFNLSNHCVRNIKENDRLSIKIDLLPEYDIAGFEEFKEFVAVSMLLNNEKNICELFNGFIKDKLSKMILDLYGMAPDTSVSKITKETLFEILDLLKNLTFEIESVAGFDSAQVCVGGVDTKELTNNFELKSVPGMFVTGELIDVCGPCGGYNLQWAFTSGAIAGEKACC
jgi:hypothetical protein